MGTRGNIAIVGAIVLVAAGGIAWWSESSTAHVEPPRPPGSANDDPRSSIPARQESEAERPAAVPRPDRESAAAPPASAAPDTALAAEKRERRRAEIETEVLLLYEDIGRDVHLDANETEELIALLVEQRMRFAEADFGESLAAVAARHELSAQFYREIQAQIGPPRAAMLATYERSIEARMHVNEIRRMFERTSLPLTEAQRKELIRQSIERGDYLTGTPYTGAESDLAMMQEMQAKSELRDQSFSTVARSVLSAEQFERYEAWAAMLRQAGDDYIRSQEAASRAR